MLPATAVRSWRFLSKDIMKKFIAIILCMVFAWGSLALWNWAEILAEATDTNAQLFDFFAALCFIVALCCSCWFNETRKNEKAEIETPDE